MDKEMLKEAWKQEWETFRYEDKLRWSRVQTISAIEAGYLAAAYVSGVSVVHGLWISIFASALVFVFCCIAVKDQRDVAAHISRIQQYERALDIPAFERASPVLGLRGNAWMMIGMIIISVLNIAVICERAKLT